MLQNHLKTELPSEWRNLFKHHESYPEDYYDVAEVELNSGEKKILVHRLVYETISGKKIEENNVIDHIQPVRSVETINNEYSNLREVTQKENMNNPETLSYRKNK